MEEPPPPTSIAGQIPTSYGDVTVTPKLEGRFMMDTTDASQIIQVPESSDSHAQTVYHCQSCPLLFSAEPALFKHLMEHHGIDPTVGSQLPSNTFTTEPSQKNLDRFCVICNRFFSQKSAFKRHMQVSHLKQRPHHCVKCGKLFAYRYQMTRHHLQCTGPWHPDQQIMNPVSHAHVQDMALHVKRLHASASDAAEESEEDTARKRLKMDALRKQIALLKQRNEQDNRSRQQYQDEVSASQTQQSHISPSDQRVMLQHPAEFLSQTAHPNATPKSEQPPHYQQNHTFPMTSFAHPASPRTRTPSLCDQQLHSTTSERTDPPHSNEEVFRCTFCGITFNDAALWGLHQGSHGLSNPAECNFCGRVARDRYDFWRHLHDHRR